MIGDSELSGTDGPGLIDVARAGRAKTPTKSHGGRGEEWSGADKSSWTITPFLIKVPSSSMGTEQNFQFQKVQRLKDLKDRVLQD